MSRLGQCRHEKINVMTHEIDITLIVILLSKV